MLRRARNANSNSTAGGNPAASKAGSGNNKDDLSSASEEEADQTDDSEVNVNTTDQQHLVCSNCEETAKELHQTGKDRALLCHKCRSYLKKHGEHRPNGDKESGLLKSNKIDDELDILLSNGKPNLRARKGKDKLNRGNSKSSEAESLDAGEANEGGESKANGVDASKLEGAGVKRSLISSDNNNNSNDSDVGVGGDEKDGAGSGGDNESDFKRKRLSPSENGDNAMSELPEMKCEIEDEDNEKPLTAIKEEDTKEAEGEVKVKIEPGTTAEPASAADAGNSQTVSVKQEANSQGEPQPAEGSPRSPQDLSSLSSRGEKHPPENVPSSSSLEGSAPSPTVKEESQQPTPQPPNASGKVSPANSSSSSSMPGSLPFPFGSNFPPFPPGAAASLSDRFPSMIPSMAGFHQPGLGGPHDLLNHSPKLPPGGAEQASTISSNKNEPSKHQQQQSGGGDKLGIPPTTGTPKSEGSSRSLNSPKTGGGGAPGGPLNFANLPSPLAPISGANDLLFSHPNFSSAHMPPGGPERLGFLGNHLPFPPGYGFPFMHPSLFNSGGRLPPGAFHQPPPFLPPGVAAPGGGGAGGPGGPSGQMSSPHSQMGKSKSPSISSQSPGHHNSSHFAKPHETGPFDRESLYQQQQHQQQQQQQDDEDNEPPYVSRGLTPEPRIDDSECIRSPAAMLVALLYIFCFLLIRIIRFLRHWNRGEHNSCARTDLIFKPVPGTRMAQKREEKARKMAEKERDDHKVRRVLTISNRSH